MYDVIVIGGGPAGLSAALMLGRCRRHVLLCDEGRPRNRRSRALHGYLARDGIAPGAFNNRGRAELVKYGVRFRSVGVTAVTPGANRFKVSFTKGADRATRFVLIATGVTDDLPAIPGFNKCYGRSVFHCPYCDGWEWRDRPLAVLGRGADGARLALGLKAWSADVLLCTEGSALTRSLKDRLARNRIAIRTERVVGLDHHRGALSAIRFAKGDPARRDALFFTTAQHIHSNLAIRLGCTLTPRGTVKTSMRCGTNVPGVFVAGDASQDAQFVVVAAAEGVKAAVAINKALQQREILD
ncbi:MAG: NAD(P)/FAD-dependent oxidoreductase [Acidobacteria bacterium]|nr:NAD(P)/FAD-dependent oxidoreductase [Acidobacteriota bacterium]